MARKCARRRAEGAGTHRAENRPEPRAQPGAGSGSALKAESLNQHPPPDPEPGRLTRKWRSGNLGRYVMVAAGDLDDDGKQEIVAVAGKEVKVFDWRTGTFALAASGAVSQEILSLAVGSLENDGPPRIILGTRDQILVCRPGDVGIEVLWESLLYPNAYFRNLTLGGLYGDGQREVIAAASGAQTIYIFRLISEGGVKRLEELGRLYLGGLVDVDVLGEDSNEIITGTNQGYVDVFVPSALLPIEGESTYIVRRGDNIWRVARRFRTTVEAIVATNGLSHPYRIDPGQVLVIPRPGSPPALR